MTTDDAIYIVLFLLIWAALSILFGALLLRFQDHPNVRWTWDWRVRVGIAIHRNLVPEFIWEWEQRSPPPWRKI